MPRSLVRGDYSLVIAIESSSRANAWYRVLADRQTGALSCDCAPWTFNHHQDEQGRRFCPHTRLAERLIGAGETVARESGTRTQAPLLSPLLSATQEQWPGLRGTWSIEERDAPIGTKPYHFVLLRLALGNGGTATGVVAFANRHHHTEAALASGVAGWAGYAIAAEVARLGGFPMVGQPPEHFRVDRRPSTSTRQRRVTPAQAPSIGLADILRVGDITDLGDGLRPEQRAENTLRLFLGEAMYTLLSQQGFLDVPSVRFSGHERVYRLRRDPARQRERRVRVFEQGQYVNDYCIVRDQDCPADDWWLTVWLGLLSDEDATLSVVQTYNVFPPYSDSRERETIPAVWRPRSVPVLA